MAEITCLNCGKVCKSLQGWKGHMSREHGGYQDKDLEAVAGVGGGEGDVRQRMSAFADKLPGAGVEDSVAGDGTAAAPRGTAPAPAMPGERRVRATPKKLKKILGGIPTEILKQSGIALDDEDVEALDEGGEFLADVFGFEFSVPEQKVVVQSRIWAILWVVGLTGLVYVKHRFPEVFKYVFKAFKKKDGEETPEPDQAATDGA
jgi:hypothetical protein